MYAHTILQHEHESSKYSLLKDVAAPLDDTPTSINASNKVKH